MSRKEIADSYRNHLALLLGAALLAGCSGGPAAQPPPVASPGATATPAASAPPGASASPASGTVFVVVMENKSPSQALSGSFTAGFAKDHVTFTNYSAVAHPSLPNYLALTSGSTHGITDDGYHRLPAGGLGTQLTEAGIAWRAYFEGLNATCFNSGYPYALKHDPFAYYGGDCPPEAVNLDRLDADLASPTPPRLAFIVPGLCSDTHDCAVGHGDAFLKALFGKITASPAYQHGGLLLLTWDEDDGSAPNRVLTLAAWPGDQAHEDGGRYNHYSLLAAVEKRLGVPLLGAAAEATPLPVPGR